MKKTIAVMSVVMLVAGGALVARAQDAPEGMRAMQAEGKMHMMGGKKMEGCARGGCPMCGKMKGMMRPSMVATSDGGVVVMIGTQLTKYDKNLKEVAKVQVEMDVAAMQAQMKTMMKDCPMMKGKGMMMAPGRGRSC